MRLTTPESITKQLLKDRDQAFGVQDSFANALQGLTEALSRRGGQTAFGSLYRTLQPVARIRKTIDGRFSGTHDGTVAHYARIVLRGAGYVRFTAIGLLAGSGERAPAKADEARACRGLCGQSQGRRRGPGRGLARSLGRGRPPRGRRPRPPGRSRGTRGGDDPALDAVQGDGPCTAPRSSRASAVASLARRPERQVVHIAPVDAPRLRHFTSVHVENVAQRLVADLHRRARPASP